MAIFNNQINIHPVCCYTNKYNNGITVPVVIDINNIDIIDKAF